jgi:hypothetical protein
LDCAEKGATEEGGAGLGAPDFLDLGRVRVTAKWPSGVCSLLQNNPIPVVWVNGNTQQDKVCQGLGQRMVVTPCNQPDQAQSLVPHLFLPGLRWLMHGGH